MFTQYRCTIIRGKSQRMMDSLLPAYAGIIHQICPCPEDEFILQFDEMISRYTRAKSENAIASAKTIANHRTEIAGKLFGLYRKNDGMVYASEKCKNYVKNEDDSINPVITNKQIYEVIGAT